MQHVSELGSGPPVDTHPLDTAATEMTLGTCQRLWHELERELLEPDMPRPVNEGAGSMQKILTQIEDTLDGSEYDFTEELAPTQPLRPQLKRRKSSVYRYKGHKRAGDGVIDRARQAAEANTPAVPYTENLRQSHRPAARTSASMKQVATLRSALRKKTPANELLEWQAMRELKRQSAPSEADVSECGCRTPSEEEDEGELELEVSEEDYAGSQTNSESIRAETPREPIGEGKQAPCPPSSLNEGPLLPKPERTESTRAPLSSSLALSVRRQTRIPAPLARRYAGKLYSSRERIVKA